MKNHLQNYLRNPPPGRGQGQKFSSFSLRNSFLSNAYIAEYSNEGQLNEIIQDPFGLENNVQEGLFEIEDVFFYGKKEETDDSQYIFVKEITSTVNSLNDMLRKSIYLTLILAAVSGLLGFLTSKISLNPLLAIIFQIKKINTEKLNKRFEIKREPREIMELKTSLNSMLDKLQKGFELQSRFSSDVAHELRTPITSLKGYSQMLKEWGFSDRTISREAVESIFNTSEEIENLIEDLLFLSGIKNSDFDMDFFEIREWFLTLEEETKRRYPLRKFLFLFDNHYNRVKSSRSLLSSLLKILVDNAVKFSEMETPVQISFLERSIEVLDFGIGIEENEKEKIFQRFYKTDPARKRNHDNPGNGIGLSIAKEIVERLNISIKIESKIREYSKFILVFPENLFK